MAAISKDPILLVICTKPPPVGRVAAIMIFMFLKLAPIGERSSMASITLKRILLFKILGNRCLKPPPIGGFAAMHLLLPIVI